MDNTPTLWPSLVTQVVNHLVAFLYTSILTRDSIDFRVYSRWVCFLCVGAAGLLVSGVSRHLSALLDYMGCSRWKEAIWVISCNIGVFTCMHSIYLIATRESRLVPDAPPARRSFPGPEDLDRGDYTINLVVKLEANQTRLGSNRRREEDFLARAGELSPPLRTSGEGAGDDEDEGNAMPPGAPPSTDFWNFATPKVLSPTRPSQPIIGESGEATAHPHTPPRIRPENLYRRPVSIPGFPIQPMTQRRTSIPVTPRGREGRGGGTQEGQLPGGGPRSVSPNTARNYPLYAEYQRTRQVSPQMTFTPVGSPTATTPRTPRGEEMRSQHLRLRARMTAEEVITSSSESSILKMSPEWRGNGQ
ncbi:unnamed protein product [Tuber aestivum]|uniref:Uncharacterized protein n=1 Tax=Tuber aestivum TaxID=59557 RepID=A0A292PT38_9PEZI|nr:unnamed protein product [Tuber aestivum]